VVGRQPNAPAAFTPGEIFRGCVDLRALGFVGSNHGKKSPVTPPGIDPGTIRLVAQHLKHYATPGPHLDVLIKFYYIAITNKNTNTIAMCRRYSTVKNTQFCLKNWRIEHISLCQLVLYLYLKTNHTYISVTADSTFNDVSLSHVIHIEHRIMSHNYVIMDLQHIFLRHRTNRHLSGCVT
jgi:hypothetical protein